MKNISVKFVGAFVAFAFAITAAPASALTTAQIVELLSGLGVSADVIAAITAAEGGSTTGTSCPTLTADQTVGSRGAEVTALQTYLIGAGQTIPAGATGYFGSQTVAALSAWQAANGVTPAVGYMGPITKAKIASMCGTTSTGSTGSSNTGSTGLMGGDGSIDDVSETTSDTETTVGEGDSEQVLGFDVEADDNSDLNITSVRVTATIASSGSTRLTRYADEINILLDGDVVGSVDASDFSRTSNVSKETIALDDAVIEAGEEGRFYVEFVADENIDTDDLDNTMVIAVDRIRYEDANGATLSETVSGVDATVDFESSTTNDDAKIKKDTSSRDASLLKVNENTSSDEFDILTFKFDVDNDSSDLVVLEIPVGLSVYNADATTTLDVEAMIKDLWVEVDGDRYDDYTLDDTSVATSATEALVATFTIDEGDLEVAEGDVVEAYVYIQFNKQSGNYTEGTTVKASVAGSAIVAENPEGDTFAVSGTATGEVQTLQIAAATVEGFDWKVNSAGTIIDFFFTVTAEDEDFSVLSSSLSSSTAGTATTSAGVLSKSTGDATTVSAGTSYTVVDGDTATFRVRYTVSGTNGTYSEVTMTSVVGQEIPDDDQVSPTATLNVSS